MADSVVGKKQTRKRKRKLYDRPSSPAKEAVSVVRCTLKKCVTSEQPERDLFLGKVEDIVTTANQMRKRVSMLAKELLLRKLGGNEEMPLPNQSFYTSLYYAMYRGTWEYGHDELLAKYRVDEPGDVSLMVAVMNFAGKRFASELKTHYQEHYERFYLRWRKMMELGKDDSGNLIHHPEYHLDPSTTPLNVLVKAAWGMLRDLEDANKRPFALFPEAKMDVSYITLDSSCIAYIFKSLFPTHSYCYKEEKQVVLKTKGLVMRKYKLKNADMAHLHGREIFGKLFNMAYINKLRGKEHQFRYTIMTDGYGVSLTFAKFIKYKDPNSKAGKAKAARRGAVRRKVVDLQPGYAYGENHKALGSLADLDGVTVRAVDPGVHRAYTSVDLTTGEEDVRTSAMALKSSSFHARTGATRYGKKQKRWHEEALGQVQAEINKVPYRKSSYAYRFAQYSSAVFRYWDQMWAFYTQMRRRKQRFTSKVSQQRELDREVNKLCKPRAGDTKTLLLFGNAASTNSFGKIKSNVKGPAKKVFDQAVRRKAAVTVWVDEFRTSRLDVSGGRLVHPEERRPRHLKPKQCKNSSHGSSTRGCQCFCSTAGCNERREVKSWCKTHRRRVLQHDVCYHNNDQHEHRMWNRDVVGALNIGCRFLAGALGRDRGLWSRKATDDPRKATRGVRYLSQPPSWAEVFGCDQAPHIFSLPTLARQ